jgi:thiamine kinase-like enzyme
MINSKDKYKLTFIDFEYAMLNFRGFDIAAYINETYMDYIVDGFPKFKIYNDEIVINFDKNPEIDRIIDIYL